MAMAGKIVARNEVSRFIVDAMVAVGTSPLHAEQLADVLVSGDYRGHYSHGLNRLDMYIADVRDEICKKDGNAKILSERAATAWVDGCNILGPVVGNFCMDLAVSKAKEAGIGFVSCKGSNHFGIAGWYGLRAQEQHGMLGLSFTNTSPFMMPTRGKEKILGTNPINLAAPGVGGDSFVLDMATTAVALGKVEIASRKNEQIPLGWAATPDGKMTTDPNAVLPDGGLMPVGGNEETGGYKGYGLAFLVEIFCGILSGSAYGPNVRGWMSTKAEANLGQCFIAIDPTAFAPGFSERLQDLMDTLRNSTPTDDSPVLVAGDKERIHMKECDTLGGIPYHLNQITHAAEIAEQLKITPMNVIN